MFGLLFLFKKSQITQNKSSEKVLLLKTFNPGLTLTWREPAIQS